MKKLFSTCVLAGLFFAQSAFALSPEEIKAKLNETAPSMVINEVRESVIDGVYEVELDGAQILLISEDGKYVITGDLYEIRNRQFVNLSDERLNGTRKEALSHLDKSDMVVFSPPEDQVKANVYVFTDVDCGYCRKLHQDIPELNRRGIAVNYLAWPRGGLDSVGYTKIVSAWCSDDPAKALTLAKLGKDIEQKSCDNPVDEQFEMGRVFGVNGTPALLLEDGSLMMGYRTPDAMEELLQAHN